MLDADIPQIQLLRIVSYFSEPIHESREEEILKQSPYLKGYIYNGSLLLNQIRIIFKQATFFTWYDVRLSEPFPSVFVLIGEYRVLGSCWILSCV